MSEWAHLVRRFVASWSRTPPSAADEEWARQQLLEAERDVWAAMAVADRRHALLVARRFDADSRAARAGALLHDCGKTDAHLGTTARVVATLYGKVRGEAARRGDGRLARYLDHEARGAAMLHALGSDPLTVALVAGRGPDALQRALDAADHV